MLKEKIIKRIHNEQSFFLPMDEYMNLALYDSEFGYYTKSKVKIGREGDFYTTVSISPVFGHLLAKWIVKRVEELNCSPTIYELGAGTGRLAASILDGLQNLGMRNREWKYIAVEGSPYHRQLIKEQPNCFGKVDIVSSIDELGPINGIVLSNEFFDAFPVKAAVFQSGCWNEVGVTVENEKLVEAYRPARESMIQFIQKIGLKNPVESQRVEIPFSYLDAYGRICELVKFGTILTIDYGMLNSEIQLGGRVNGSLRGFYKHRLVDNLFDQPGEMDITSSLLFDEMIQIGEAYGLTTRSFQKQNRFLLENGILDLLVEHQDRDPFSEKSRQNRAIIQLIQDGDISSYFYVLEQMKLKEQFPL